MTKEKAVEILEDVQKSFFDNAYAFSKEELSELDEAFKMAIMALAEQK